MRVISLVLVFAICLLSTQALKDLIGTPIHKCVNCLCHARSGCWSRFNCARYSISFDYWKKAKSPVVSRDDDPDSQDSYKKCMANENCIVNTIYNYISSFGSLDCNCDGKTDCKDWFALHLFGEECFNPKFGERYARRFNHCASSIGVNVMAAEEGDTSCSTKVDLPEAQ